MLAYTQNGTRWCDAGWRFLVRGDELVPGDEWRTPDRDEWQPVFRPDAPADSKTSTTGFPRNVEFRRRDHADALPDWTADRAKVSTEAVARAILTRYRCRPAPLDLCGCGEHAIPAGADRYAEHREWVARVRGLEGSGVSQIGAEPRTEPVMLVEIMHEDFV